MTGTKRPFGLDCSGFVAWSFINSGFNASGIGHGTQGQIAKCSRISWSSAQAGDLAFYSDLSRVGIVAGKDADGNILAIHCSSGRNNAVITTNTVKMGCSKNEIILLQPILPHKNLDCFIYSFGVYPVLFLNDLLK